jgi:hypothetical protein
MVIPQSPSPTMNPQRYDFTQNPMLVYWEMTQACMLACRHCRAQAMPSPHARELTPIETLGLLCQIVSFGDPLPHLILTGGDPLSRKDLFRVIDDARALGLPSLRPTARQLEPSSGHVIRLEIEARVKRCGGEMRLVLPPDHLGQEAWHPAPSLLKGVARGRTWYEWILAGEVG